MAQSSRSNLTKSNTSIITFHLHKSTLKYTNLIKANRNSNHSQKFHNPLTSLNFSQQTNRETKGRDINQDRNPIPKSTVKDPKKFVRKRCRLVKIFSFWKYWADKWQIIKFKQKKNNLSVLGVELLGNVGLLVHGDRTGKTSRREKRRRRKSSSADEGQIGPLRSFSLSLVSLIIMRPKEKRKREGQRSRQRRSWLYFCLSYYLRVLFFFFHFFFLFFFSEMEEKKNIVIITCAKIMTQLKLDHIEQFFLFIICKFSRKSFYDQ